MKWILYCFMLAYSFAAQATEKGTNREACLAAAQTQFAMNKCEGVNLQQINAELARVLAAIKSNYHAKPEFLAKLAASQQAWQTSLQADLAMKFPLENKPLQYGSVYPMCSSSFQAQLTLQRIALLKQWIQGAEEGEVCSGSVLNSFYLNTANHHDQ